MLSEKMSDVHEIQNDPALVQVHDLGNRHIQIKILRELNSLANLYNVLVYSCG